MANKIILKHSSVVTEEKPKLPSKEQLDYGELAVNYADGHETITLKNTNNDIVEFKSKEYFENIISENELIISESLISINDDINSLFDAVRNVEEGIEGIGDKQDKLTISDGLTLNNNTLSHADTNTNINADTSYGPTSAVTQSAKSTANFKVPQITLDKFGHVKSVTEREITVTDTDTDTHYATGIKAGESGTNANSSTTNPYIKVLDDTTYRSQIQLKGSGSTTVSSDANGVITISSTDNDTKSFTITANAEDDDIIVLSGTSGTNAVTYKATHAKKGPSSDFTGSDSTSSISGSGESGTLYIPKINVDQYGHINSVSNSTVSITMPTIPTALKNPNALTVGTKSYDGSTGVTINASDLGLESALKYHGTTTTNIVDDATTKPIVIDGKNHEQENGCVVFYGNKEFVWNGSKWEEFGNEGNYKVVQTAVSSPSANGNATAFIDTISQDTNGNITVTKKNVDLTHSHNASFTGTSGTTVSGKTDISVSSSFTGNNHKHTVKATGSISNTVTDNGHTHTITPSGSVSSTFTGTSHTHTATLTDSYSAGTLTLTISVEGTVATGSITSEFAGTTNQTTSNNATGISVSSTFSGNTVDSSEVAATGSVSSTVTDNGHTHTFTPSGNVSIS